MIEIALGFMAAISVLNLIGNIIILAIMYGVLELED